MADNFRNKQWFKKLSQERKDEICRKFDIDEKTLKKAGRETDDGSIVINLLKIDHLLHNPESWTKYNEVFSKNKINSCKGDEEALVENAKYIYGLFDDVKFLKYKPTLHNNVVVKQMSKYINKWIDKYNNVDNVDDKEYFAYQIFEHVRSLIESDLNLVKE